jgi:ribose 5-phosphate isomerase B
MKLAIACDHRGVALKNALVAHLRAAGHEVDDLGTNSEESVDYPDFAEKVAVKVSATHGETQGVLICGTGLGMSIAANKVPGVRAALGNDALCARMSREHNNANVLCLGHNIVDAKQAAERVDVWLATTYEGGRHDGRLAKIDAIDQRSHAGK